MQCVECSTEAITTIENENMLEMVWSSIARTTLVEVGLFEILRYRGQHIQRPRQIHLWTRMLVLSDMTIGKGFERIWTGQIPQVTLSQSAQTDAIGGSMEFAPLTLIEGQGRLGAVLRGKSRILLASRTLLRDKSYMCEANRQSLSKSDL